MIRTPLAGLFLVFFALAASAQEPDCTSVRTGFSLENDKFIQDYRVKADRNGYWGYSSMSAMLKVGLEGKVFAYAGASDFDDGDFSLSGFFVRIERLPNRSEIDAKRAEFEVAWQFNEVAGWPLFNDDRAQELIHSKLKQIPFLLTTQTQFIAMVPMSEANDLRKSLSACIFASKENAPFVVLTPEADYYAVLHELVHYEDVISGLSNRIEKDLSAPRFAGLTEKERDNVSAFIIEHRAYHLEYEKLTADIKAGVKFKKIDGRRDQRQDERMLENIPNALHNYAKSLRDLLERKKLDTEIHAQIVSLVKSHSPEGSELGLRSLFPELFTNGPR
ncbi:MAG: hypothetical protein ABL958_18360 [Bdellovibrionia bacterium]